jgi:hypothetical protein
MTSPRFGIKSLLFTVAMAALWLSTFTGYYGAGDVRSFIMLCILVAAGVAAINYDGRRRAFWAGFFITVLVVGINHQPAIGVQWIRYLLNSYGLYQNLPNGNLDDRFIFLDATMQAAVSLLIATATGFIGILVSENCQRDKD